MHHAIIEPLGLIPEVEEENVTEENQQNEFAPRSVRRIEITSAKKKAEIGMIAIEEYRVEEDGTLFGFEDNTMRQFLQKAENFPDSQKLPIRG